MKTLTLSQIRQVLPTLDLIPAIESGFEAYSAGQAVVPPVGELLLEKGDVHIKYGYLRGDDYYVIKIASGFYENSRLGLPSSNGLMLLFRQGTGQLESILLDEGYLTDIRTAVAGAIAAKYLAPKNITGIGIVGTGIQARLQLDYLKVITDCQKVWVWGRGENQLERYTREMAPKGFEITATQDCRDILEQCNLVVTTTPSMEPLLYAERLRAGTHITAIGSDTAQKQELDSAILAKADLLVADSLSQCVERGEIFKALSAGLISKDKVVELGQIIAGKNHGRVSENQITVADLTGVAVQDIKIATAVYQAAQRS
ncbi:ornithine cyclodeaminase family protein [bacterium]|nr:ornithine cyclodeaminase family protein [bacterium]